MLIHNFGKEKTMDQQKKFDEFQERFKMSGVDDYAEMLKAAMKQFGITVEEVSTAYGCQYPDS